MTGSVSHAEECCWTTWLTTPLLLAGAGSIGTYLIVLLLQNILDYVPVNLKKKYNASWALVTGGSSGIGRGIVEKLAEQQINVVIVALQDKLLDDFYAEISKQYPKLSFRKIGVDLGSANFLSEIINKTNDINIQLLFNNAGYIVPGFFHAVDISSTLRNHHTNNTCCLSLTQFYVNKMIVNKQKGLVAFTSSSAGFLPNPLSAMYSSTKAFLTMFGTSLAAEIRPFGVDVVVVHPSPMATNFFSHAPNLSALNAFKRFANKPSIIADVIFSSAGRFVVRDQGTISIIFKLILKFIDLNFFCEIVARFGYLSGDYRKFKKEFEDKQK